MSKQLNPNQQRLAESLTGIYIVDAGAGTGKTETVTRRYLNILETGVHPDSILMLTFTKNAAEEMKTRIINACRTVPLMQIVNAPISTFHSFCSSILGKYGIDTPQILGIESKLSNYGVFEDDIIESRFFEKFFARFRRQNVHYGGYYSLIKSDDMLKLIKSLCCKGIFPAAEGFFGSGEAVLRGDYNEYKNFFDMLNAPVTGKNGKENQSVFWGAFKSKLRDGEFDTVPETLLLLKEDKSAKVLPENYMHDAFNEDRTELVQFVHDVYYGYLEHCVRLGRLNFEFMIMFSFILLYTNHELREKTAFEHVIVDEFQDTDEIQFMLVLLLLKKPNLCAVGDWKQGIYSFRNATVDNIIDFEHRLNMYKKELNTDFERIRFELAVTKINLDINYRSHQQILDFSERALNAPASKDDEANPAAPVVHLNAGTIHESSHIECIRPDIIDEEIQGILNKIQQIVNNPEYRVKNKAGDWVPAQYKDIAVLVRGRKFAFKLQQAAIAQGVPVSFEGQMEIFREQPALVSLAWLRLLADIRDMRGIAAVMEYEGYTASAIKAVCDPVKETMRNAYKDGPQQKTDEDNQNVKDSENNYRKVESRCRELYPKEIIAFIDLLKEDMRHNRINIVSAVKRVLNRYSINNAYSDALIVILEKIFRSVSAGLSDVIQFLEDAVSHNKTCEVSFSGSDESVKIKTIHKSKGLEFPVVILADMNYRRFPSAVPETCPLFFNHLTGLRIKKEIVQRTSIQFVLDKWQTSLLSIKLFSDYDEERRLLYVALTRAKHHLILSAGKRPSGFFEYMAEEMQIHTVPTTLVQGSAAAVKVHSKTPEFKAHNYQSPGFSVGAHGIMGEYIPPGQGKGIQFGNMLHNFAHKYALGRKLKWEEPEANLVTEFLDSLKNEGAELLPEIDCSYNIDDVMINGIIDLLVLLPDRALIVDYKSDMTEVNEPEYQKQLSVYYQVITELYPSKKVSCMLFYVCRNLKKTLEPLSQNALRNILAEKGFII